MIIDAREFRGISNKETILLQIFWVSRESNQILVELNIEKKVRILSWISYIKLLMATLKMKSRSQYKISKSRDGGDNNTYHIFTSWVEEGSIPNTMFLCGTVLDYHKNENHFLEWTPVWNAKNPKWRRE